MPSKQKLYQRIKIRYLSTIMMQFSQFQLVAYQFSSDHRRTGLFVYIIPGVVSKPSGQVSQDGACEATTATKQQQQLAKYWNNCV